MKEEEYFSQVLDEYYKHFGGDSVDHYLKNPTAGNIKEAAKERFKDFSRNPSHEDFSLIIKFLKATRKEYPIKVNSSSELFNEIEKYPFYDRVVKIVKEYKKGNAYETKIANIDFLAWLIDFNDRPLVKRNDEAFQKRKIEDLKSDFESLFTTEKGKLLLDQLMFNEEFLSNLKNKLLIQVLEDYNLENNASFRNYRDKIKDDIILQSFTIKRLESKVHLLHRQLKRARSLKRWAGSFGLFFLAIEYRKPSFNHLFEDLFEDYLGIDDLDDFFDDLV